MRSYHVVVSSLMILSSEMRERLKIDVSNLLSRSINMPRLDSRRKSKQRRVNANTFKKNLSSENSFVGSQLLRASKR